MICTTDQRDMLRRSIKVMSAGQTINREEKKRRILGWRRLYPKYHALGTCAGAYYTDQRLMKDNGRLPSKRNPTRWQDYVPADFEDRRAEFLDKHLSDMRFYQLTDFHTGAHLRAMNLAYAFIRSVPYRSVEQKANNAPPFNLIMKTIAEHQVEIEFVSDLEKALADWFLDHTEEIPEDDWQMSIPDMRYKLRNISQGKPALEGLPKYEAEKERQRQEALGKARAASSTTLN